MSRTLTVSQARTEGISPHISWEEAATRISAQGKPSVRPAATKGQPINNVPNQAQLNNMVALADNIFEPLREMNGNRPIWIHSFFRNKDATYYITYEEKGAEKAYENSVHEANSTAAIDISAIESQGYTTRDLLNILLSENNQGGFNFNFQKVIVYVNNKGDSNRPNTPVRFLHIEYNRVGGNKRDIFESTDKENYRKVTITYPLPVVGGTFEQRATGNQARTDNEIHHLEVDFWIEGNNSNLHEAFPASKFDHNNPSFTLINVLTFEKDGISNRDRLLISQPVELSQIAISEEWRDGVRATTISQTEQSKENRIVFKAGTPVYIDLSWLKKSSQDINEITNAQNEADFRRMQSLIPQTGSRDIAPFYVEKLQTLQSDEKYKRRQPVQDGGVLLSSQGLEVWIWIRSLGHIYNVTKFVTTLSTNSTKQHGSFNFSLTHINRLDGLKPSDNVFFSAFSQAKGNLSFWNKHLSVNDIVWIKFEELEIENRKDEFEVDEQRLAGQIYDMIGLIDSVSESKNKNNLDSSFPPSPFPYSA